VLIIGEAERFALGKQISAYLGLVPEQDSSGERHEQNIKYSRFRNVDIRRNSKPLHSRTDSTCFPMI